jgi:hypothetical protein
MLSEAELASDLSGAAYCLVNALTDRSGIDSES